MSNIAVFENLYTKEYDVHVYNAAKQDWNIQNKFTCINSPKPNDMFLMFKGCSGEYRLADGNIITAKQGSMVYVPRGSRYETIFYNTNKDTYSTGIINFDLYDENRNIFSISDKIEIIDDINYSKYELIFLSMVAISSQNIRFPGGMKADFHRIVAELCRHFHRQNIFSDRYQIISKGILYLEENENLTLSVSEISSLCNVSEIYFRKLFKEYSGMTPSQFRINKKIEKAKQYLVFENKSIREISDILGFNDTAYFCRVFKEKTGFTPSQYINNNH